MAIKLDDFKTDRIQVYQTIEEERNSTMKALNEGELQLEHDPTTFMCSLITSSCVHLLILCIAFPTKLLECLKSEIEHQKEDKIIERKKDTMN